MATHTVGLLVFCFGTIFVLIGIAMRQRSMIDLLKSRLDER